MAMRIRPLTVEETETIRRLAHARTEPGRRVERARIVWLSLHGQRASVIARDLCICIATARFSLKRFNVKGIAGLEDEPRPGPAPTYTPEQVSALITFVLTKLSALAHPRWKFVFQPKYAAYVNLIAPFGNSCCEADPAVAYGRRLA